MFLILRLKSRKGLIQEFEIKEICVLNIYEAVLATVSEAIGVEPIPKA